MAALRKALLLLFDGKVPSEEDAPDVARVIFRAVCDATPGGAEDEITKSDMYNYLCSRSEVSPMI